MGDTCLMVMEESESTGSTPEVAETLVVSITTESTLTNTILDISERLEWGTSTCTPTTPTFINQASTLINCGPWCLSRPEPSMLVNLRRLQSLTVPEQDFTRFWARMFSPSSQSLSRPDSSQEEQKRRSRLSEALAF